LISSLAIVNASFRSSGVVASERMMLKMPSGFYFSHLAVSPSTLVVIPETKTNCFVIFDAYIHSLAPSSKVISSLSPVTLVEMLCRAVAI
jgi:hypothetical protein